MFIKVEIGRMKVTSPEKMQVGQICVRTIQIALEATKEK